VLFNASRNLRGGALLVLAITVLLYTLTDAAVENKQETGKLVNCVGTAGGFFNNMRTPAALLSGFTLGNMWAGFGNESTRHPKLQGLYSFFMAITAVLELSVVFMATASSSQLLDPQNDPMAVDCFTFLMRDYEFSYLACRVFFVTGIMTTLLSVAIRAWFVFHNQRFMSNAIICLVIAGLAQMINFFNWSIRKHEQSFFGLWHRLVLLYWNEWVNGFDNSDYGVPGLWSKVALFGLAGAAMNFMLSMSVGTRKQESPPKQD